MQFCMFNTHADTCLNMELQVVHVIRLPLCATGMDHKELQGIPLNLVLVRLYIFLNFHYCFVVAGFAGGDQASPHGHGR